MGIIKKAYNSKVWKGVRKFTGDRYGRYDKKGATFGYNFPKMAQDIKTIGSMVNAEKKRIEQNVGQVLVGQYNGVGVSGHYISDITPIVPQGITIATRNGASIKLHSSVMKFQVAQQANTITTMRLKVFIIKVIGPTITPNIANFFDINPFTNAYDINSSRNIDKMVGFKILKVQNVTLKADNLATENSKMEFMMAWKHKGDSHIRYDKDTNNVTKGQILMIIVADTGDVINTSSTGVGIQNTTRHFYYDNSSF